MSCSASPRGARSSSAPAECRPDGAWRRRGRRARRGRAATCRSGTRRSRDRARRHRAAARRRCAWHRRAGRRRASAAREPRERGPPHRRRTSAPRRIEATARGAAPGPLDRRQQGLGPVAVAGPAHRLDGEAACLASAPSIPGRAMNGRPAGPARAIPPARPAPWPPSPRRRRWRRSAPRPRGSALISRAAARRARSYCSD